MSALSKRRGGHAVPRLRRLGSAFHRAAPKSAPKHAQAPTPKHAKPGGNSSARLAGQMTVLVGLAGAGAFAITGPVTAGFTATGSGQGLATVASLATPSDVMALETSPAGPSPRGEERSALEALPSASFAMSVLRVSWGGVAFPGGGTGGYYVLRYNGAGGSPVPACGTSPSSLLAPSVTGCTDSGLTPGTSYQYQVIAAYGSWSSASSLSSPTGLAPSALNDFTVIPATLAPTTGAPFSVSLTALDQYGGTDAGYTGPECVTFSGPDGTPAPDGIAPSYPSPGGCTTGSSVTFTDGLAAVEVTLVDPETTALEVTDNATGASGTSPPITVGGPGAVTTTTVPSTTTTTSATTTTEPSSAEGSLALFSVAPATLAAAAGSPIEVTLSALASLDAVDTAYSGPECVTFSGPDDAPDTTAPSYPSQGDCATGSSVTFVDGFASVEVTLVDPETTPLQVTDSATGASGTSPPITVGDPGAVTTTTVASTTTTSSATTTTMGTTSTTSGTTSTTSGTTSTTAPTTTGTTEPPGTTATGTTSTTTTGTILPS